MKYIVLGALLAFEQVNAIHRYYPGVTFIEQSDDELPPP